MALRKRKARYTGLDFLESRQLLSAAVSSVVHRFIGDPSTSPLGIVVADNGDIFGVQSVANTQGGLFRIAEGTGQYQTLYTFSGNQDGGSPDETILVDHQGDLFGTTASGGANGLGTIFELKAGATAVTTLYSYTSDGRRRPIALDADGNLYGAQSGSTDRGTVFEIAAGGTQVEQVYAFSSAQGTAEVAGLAVDGAGNIYGSMMLSPPSPTFNSVMARPHSLGIAGPQPYGVIFKISTGSSAYQSLYTFDTNHYMEPIAVDAQGNIFGTTSDLSEAQRSIAYELKTGASEIDTLNTFQFDNGMALDSQGNLFGLSMDNASGEGDVYEVPAGGSYEHLASIDDYPWGSVAIDARGDVFSTTTSFDATIGNNGQIVEFVAPLQNALAFTAEPPATATTGKPLAGVVTVVTQDMGKSFNYGNAPVTLQIVNAPAGVTLGGTFTTTEINGVATFDDLVFSHAGTYTLMATSGTMGPAVSTTVVVTDPPPLQASSVAAPRVAREYPLGAAITLATKVSSAGASTGACAGTVSVEDENHNVLGTGTIGKGGSVKLKLTAASGGTHVCTLIYAGDGVHAGTESAPFTVTVMPGKSKVSLQATAEKGDGATSVVLVATVVGMKGFAATGTVIFYDGGVEVGSGTLDADGTARVSLKGVASGKHAYGVIYGGDTNHQASHSSNKRIRVRG